MFKNAKSKLGLFLLILVLIVGIFIGSYFVFAGEEMITKTFENYEFIDMNVTIIDKYQVLFPDGSGEVHQILNITNNDVENNKTYNIAYSYPKSDKIKSILKNKEKEKEKKSKIKPPLFDDALDSLVDTSLKPPKKDYESDYYTILLEPNETRTIDFIITHSPEETGVFYLNFQGSSGGTTLFFDNGTYSFSDVSKNIWWRKLSIADTIAANTILIMPHHIDSITGLDTGEIVEPIKIMYTNKTEIDWGYKITKNTQTRLKQFNNSDFSWQPSFNLISGDEFRIQFGKRAEFKVDGNYVPGTSYSNRNDAIYFNVSKIPDVVNITLYGYSFTELEGFGVVSTSCSDNNECGGALTCDTGHLYSISGCLYDACVVTATVNPVTYKVYLASGGTGTCYWEADGGGPCYITSKSASWSGASGTIGNYAGACEAEFTHDYWNEGTIYVDSWNHGGSLDGVTVTYVAKTFIMNVNGNNYLTYGTTSDGSGWLADRANTASSGYFANETSVGDNYLNFTAQTDGLVFVTFDHQVENVAPTILTNYTIPQTVSYGDTFYINARINDSDATDTIIYTNFTVVYPNGTTMMDNVNGTIDTVFTPGSDLNWTSTPGLIADDGGTYLWYLNTSDNSNDITVSNGEFTISDTTAPIIISITSPTNNTEYILTSDIDINVTWTDDMRGSYLWFNIQNSSGDIIQANTSFTYCGSTICGNNISQFGFPLADNMTVNVYVNDTSGNEAWGQIINLNVTTDTSSPSITITEPSGTKTSYTIPIEFTITDNVAVSTCEWNITLTSDQTSSGLANSSGLLTNCTQSFTIALGLEQETDFTFRIQSNDTFNNWKQSSSSFTISIPPPAPPAPVGGGGGVILLSILGESCETNEACASGICDLEKSRLGKVSTTYQTCLEEGGRCGNNICSLAQFDEEGNEIAPRESYSDCPKDCGIISLEDIKGSTFITYTLVLFFGGIFLLSIMGKDIEKKIPKKWRKWIR